MVKIVPVSDEEKEMLKTRRLGRISWSIIKQFEESGYDIARVEVTDRSPESLAYTLRSYIRSHNLPYRIMVRHGALYIQRKPPEEEVPKLDESVVE